MGSRQRKQAPNSLQLDFIALGVGLRFLELSDSDEVSTTLSPICSHRRGFLHKRECAKSHFDSKVKMIVISPFPSTK